MAQPRILIVTTPITVARALGTRLTALGYAVAGVTASGADAVAMAPSVAPELLLCGVTLDDMGGATLAHTLRQRGPLPVVFMGTAADEANARRDGLAESDGYLVPPAGDRELQVHIELALSRHRAARATHELESFFAVSLDMFCFLGFDGYFRRLNPAWERTLGFTREELMARPFIEFVHPDDRERTLRQNAQVRSGGLATGFENRYLCKDGSHRWLLWNAAPLTAAGVIYSAARDITARKEAEAERAQLVRTLEASLAEVSRLQEILPICMYCRKIRDDENYWHEVESYISRHTKSQFSHGICPSCMETEVEPLLTGLEGD